MSTLVCIYWFHNMLSCHLKLSCFIVVKPHYYTSLDFKLRFNYSLKLVFDGNLFLYICGDVLSYIDRLAIKKIIQNRCRDGDKI